MYRTLPGTLVSSILSFPILYYSLWPSSLILPLPFELAKSQAQLLEQADTLCMKVLWTAYLWVVGSQQQMGTWQVSCSAEFCSTDVPDKLFHAHSVSSPVSYKGIFSAQNCCTAHAVLCIHLYLLLSLFLTIWLFFAGWYKNLLYHIWHLHYELTLYTESSPGFLFTIFVIR